MLSPLCIEADRDRVFSQNIQVLFSDQCASIIVSIERQSEKDVPRYFLFLLLRQWLQVIAESLFHKVRLRIAPACKGYGHRSIGSPSSSAQRVVVRHQHHEIHDVVQLRKEIRRDATDCGSERKKASLARGFATRTTVLASPTAVRINE